MSLSAALKSQQGEGYWRGFQGCSFDEKQSACGVVPCTDRLAGRIPSVPFCGKLELFGWLKGPDERDCGDYLVVQATPDDTTVVTRDNNVKSGGSATHVDVDGVVPGISHPECDDHRFPCPHSGGEYEQEIGCIDVRTR